MDLCVLHNAHTMKNRENYYSVGEKNLVFGFPMVYMNKYSGVRAVHNWESIVIVEEWDESICIQFITSKETRHIMACVCVCQCERSYNKNLFFCQYIFPLTQFRFAQITKPIKLFSEIGHNLVIIWLFWLINFIVSFFCVVKKGFS